MKKFILILLIITLYFPVFSHYQWITVDNYNPVTGGDLNIMINAGHNFPNIGFLLKRALIFSTELISKNRRYNFKIEKTEKTWKSKIVNLKGKPNIVEFTLKKRTASEPFFLGRALINVEGNNREDIVYSTGVGLEIVPEDLFEKHINDPVIFRLLLNGKSVRSSIVLIPEGKKGVYLNPANDGTYHYQFNREGLYLMNAWYKNKGTSLTFMITKQIP